MKKYLFIFFSFFYLSSYAQYTDGVVADLINKREFFNLENQIDSLSKNIYYEHLKYIAKGLVDFYANKPEESNIFFDKLFSEHKNEIDAQSLYMFELIRGVNYIRLKQYDLAYNLFSQIEKNQKSDFYLKICNVKKEYPDSTEWKSVPIILYKDSTGLPIIQIKDLNDSIHPFIFDTGSPYSCIPESDCSKFGIKVLVDSLDYFGRYIKAGIAPKLKIGKIITYNMLFLIFPDPISKITKTNIDLRIIGWDFMYRADNIQLTDSTITFNQKLKNKQLENFLIDWDKPLVNIQIGGSNVIFLLDTGNQSSFINSSEEIKLNSFVSQNKLDSIGVGGFFGIKVERYKLFNNVPISSGSSEKIISNLKMRYPSEGIQNAPEQSLLGQDILQLFTKKIIDIKNNTFILE